MYAVTEVEGRGRGCISTCLIPAGTTIIQEKPIILLVHAAVTEQCCANCLRLFIHTDSDSASGSASPQSMFQTLPLHCNQCSQVYYCTEQCQQQHALSHPSLVCNLYQQLSSAAASHHLDADSQTSGRFLIAAYQLRQNEIEQYTKLKQLVSVSLTETEKQVATLLHEIISPFFTTTTTTIDHSLASLSLHSSVSNTVNSTGAGAGAVDIDLGETVTLLGIDKSNGFAIMAPPSAEGELQIRGTAICLNAAMLNHHCMPTCVRFDEFDRRDLAPLDRNCSTHEAIKADGTTTTTTTTTTDNNHNHLISFRTLRTLEPYSELTISYVPLSAHRTVRQQRLKEEYQFTCQCERCSEEATWDEEEEDEDDDEDEDDEDDEDVTDDENVNASDFADSKCSSFSTPTQSAACSGTGTGTGNNRNCCDADGTRHADSSNHGHSASTDSGHIVDQHTHAHGPLGHAHAHPHTHTHSMMRQVIAMFECKYLCTANSSIVPSVECTGTLAPLSPAEPDTMICNTCHAIRTQQQFEEQLQAEFGVDADEEDYSVDEEETDQPDQNSDEEAL